MEPDVENEWELVQGNGALFSGIATIRLRIDGGWLYLTMTGIDRRTCMAFVPDTKQLEIIAHPLVKTK